MRSWAGKSLTTFLALSVLAGGVLPPAYSHLHPGGNASHDHSEDRDRADHSRRHSHAHHHDGDGHHRHHPPDKTVNNSRDRLDNSGLHWHVTLLFFDFTLPDLPGPDGGSENDGKQPPTATCLIDLSRVMPTESSRACWLTWQESADVSLIDAVVAVSAGPSRPPLVTRVLLCDAARRDRSGVLLT